MSKGGVEFLVTTLINVQPDAFCVQSEMMLRKPRAIARKISKVSIRLVLIFLS
jgi:hypothetical protein